MCFRFFFNASKKVDDNSWLLKSYQDEVKHLIDGLENDYFIKFDEKNHYFEIGHKDIRATLVVKHQKGIMFYNGISEAILSMQSTVYSHRYNDMQV